MSRINNLNIKEMSIDNKIDLAAEAGYQIKVINTKGRCYIVGADSFCNNDFKTVDEVLYLIRPDLKRIHRDFVA